MLVVAPVSTQAASLITRPLTVGDRHQPTKTAGQTPCKFERKVTHPGYSGQDVQDIQYIQEIQDIQDIPAHNNQIIHSWQTWEKEFFGKNYEKEK